MANQIKFLENHLKKLLDRDGKMRAWTELFQAYSKATIVARRGLSLIFLIFLVAVNLKWVNNQVVIINYELNKINMLKQNNK